MACVVPKVIRDTSREQDIAQQRPFPERAAHPAGSPVEALALPDHVEFLSSVPVACQQDGDIDRVKRCQMVHGHCLDLVVVLDVDLMKLPQKSRNRTMISNIVQLIRCDEACLEKTVELGLGIERMLPREAYEVR